MPAFLHVPDRYKDWLLIAVVAAVCGLLYLRWSADEGLATIPETAYSFRALRDRSKVYTDADVDLPDYSFPVMTSDYWVASTCEKSGACGDGSLRHFTLATNFRPGLDILLHTCSHYGSGVDVVGMGDRRFRKWGEGFGVKVQMLHRYAAAQPPDTLILFTDAFDVLCMGTQQQMLDGFATAMKRAKLRSAGDAAFSSRTPAILFSAELFPTPTDDVIPLYPSHDRGHVFNYLNSGGILCTARDLVLLMNALPYDVATVVNDQFYFVDAFLLSQRNASLPWVVLDHDNDVFISMAGVEYRTDMTLHPVTHRWKHVKTEGHPSVVHFQGYFGLKKGLPFMYKHAVGNLAPDAAVTWMGVGVGVLIGLAGVAFLAWYGFPRDSTLAPFRAAVVWIAHACSLRLLGRVRRDPDLDV